MAKKRRKPITGEPDITAPAPLDADDLRYAPPEDRILSEALDLEPAAAAPADEPSQEPAADFAAAELPAPAEAPVMAAAETETLPAAEPSAAEDAADRPLDETPGLEPEPVIAAIAAEEPGFPAGDLDIEAALAAVASLSDVMAEREAAEQARAAQAEAEAQAAAERQARLEHPERFFPAPPSLAQRRGGLTSVVPGVLLILVGAWLTFAFTTTPPPAGWPAAALVGAAALALLAHWWASGRWARGTLFAGLWLALSAAVIAALVSAPEPGMGRGWPLLLPAAGAAFILTGLLARPAGRDFILPGLALVAAGLAGLAVTLGVLEAQVVTAVGAWWPAVLAVVAVLLLLPALRRSR